RGWQGDGTILGPTAADSVPEHGDPGIDERQDADAPEQRRGDAAGLALASLTDAEQRADDEYDHELRADLGVVELLALGHTPWRGEGESGDGGDRDADVHQPGDLPSSAERLHGPGAEQHGEADEMDEQNEVAQGLHGPRLTNRRA